MLPFHQQEEIEKALLLFYLTSLLYHFGTSYFKLVTTSLFAFHIHLQMGSRSHLNQILAWIILRFYHEILQVYLITHHLMHPAPPASRSLLAIKISLNQVSKSDNIDHFHKFRIVYACHITNYFE